MAWQFHPILVVFALGGLVSLAVAAYCFRYLRTYGRSYLVGSIGLLGFHNAIWVFAALLKTASMELERTLLFYKLEFLGILPISVIVLVLALAYVGKDPWLSRRRIALASIVPVVLLVLTLLNPGNVMIANPELVRDQGILALEHEFPPLFAVYLAWLLGTVLIAMLFLGWGVLADRVQAAPTVTAIVALLLPYVVGVLKLLDVYPPGGEGINLTPVMGGIGIIVFAVAIMRYRVFDLIPVGRDQAIEVMADGYLLVNAEGTILDANPAATDLLGIATDTDLKHQPITEVVPVYSDLSESNPVDLETENRTVEIRRSNVTRQNQEAGEVLLLQDVTEKRRQERELKRRNERLDQFASTISHDLRNPLNVAQGRLDLVGAETDSEHLAAIENAHNRMEALIDNVLTLARHGDQIQETEPVDLADLAEMTWATVETADATLVTETEQLIQADPSRVQQMLENLFRNAVEHGGPDVTVTVAALDDGFYVADNGPGIPSAEREEVFNMGYSMGGDSTGFGLNIVEQIAETHGWNVRITDSDDGGARFEFTGVEVQ